jgi:hypothetical protein
MKKTKLAKKDELRAEYKRSDFTGTMVRGKYAKRLKQSSNVVVLTPEVAAAFPNDDAVNSALLSLLRLARSRPASRSGARAKTARR